MKKDMVLASMLVLTILGTMLLIQLNNRSSILIKEMVFVSGSAAVMLWGAARSAREEGAWRERVGARAVILFGVLIAWMLFRHFDGVESVNGEDYIYRLLALGGMVFVMASFLDEKARDIVLWGLVSVTGLVSLYALLQANGMIIFPWDAGMTQAARSSGTMGNPNLMGSVAMAMIPVSLGFLVGREKLGKARYPVAGVFALLYMGALVASKTRGSLLGFAALIFMVPMVPSIRRNRKHFLAVLAVIVILAGLSAVLLHGRMGELMNTESGTLQVRKLIWSGAVDMWLKNPLLGYGPGSFQIVFPKFRSPDYFLLGVSHNTLHAHCEYLEILIDIGVIGLLLWAALGFALIKPFMGGFLAGKSGKDVWTLLGIAGGITALLAEGLVSVALRWPPSAFLLALLLGLLLTFLPAKTSGKKRSSRARYGVSAALLLTSAFLFFKAVPDYLNSMKAGKELFEGKDVFLMKIEPGIRKAVDSAMRWSETDAQDDADKAVYYLTMAREMADSSIAWCKRCVQSDPDGLGGWYALGSAYISKARLYQHFNPALTRVLEMKGCIATDSGIVSSLLLKGLAAYDSLRSKAPDYAEIHNNLSLVWVSLGNADSALGEMRKAWDLHVHNRVSYGKKVELLNPLTRSLDGVYVKWSEDLMSLQRFFEERGPGRVAPAVFRDVMFDFGATMYRFPGKADSLAEELAGMLSSTGIRELEDMVPLVRRQAERWEEGYELAEAYASGNLARVEEILADADSMDLEVLPVHRTVRALVDASGGDIRGIGILVKLEQSFLWNGLDKIRDFPLDIMQVFEVASGSIFETGLDTKEERLLLYRHLGNLLDLDRRILEMMYLLDSAPELKKSSQDFVNYFMETWGGVGGPFYTFTTLGDTSGYPPILIEGGLLDSELDHLIELAHGDSAGVEPLVNEMAWLFVLFSSSYSAMPHYNISQTARVVDMLADEREILVGKAGEEETRYMLARMLETLQNSWILNVDGSFREYVDALKNDLIVGRISRPDLP